MTDASHTSAAPATSTAPTGVFGRQALWTLDDACAAGAPDGFTFFAPTFAPRSWAPGAAPLPAQADHDRWIAASYPQLSQILPIDGVYAVSTVAGFFTDPERPPPWATLAIVGAMDDAARWAKLAALVSAIRAALPEYSLSERLSCGRLRVELRRDRRGPGRADDTRSFVVLMRQFGELRDVFDTLGASTMEVAYDGRTTTLSAAAAYAHTYRVSTVMPGCHSAKQPATHWWNCNAGYAVAMPGLRAWSEIAANKAAVEFPVGLRMADITISDVCPSLATGELQLMAQKANDDCGDWGRGFADEAERLAAQRRRGNLVELLRGTERYEMRPSLEPLCYEALGAAPPTFADALPAPEFAAALDDLLGRAVSRPRLMGAASRMLAALAPPSGIKARRRPSQIDAGFLAWDLGQALDCGGAADPATLRMKLAGEARARYAERLASAAPLRWWQAPGPAAPLPAAAWYGAGMAVPALDALAEGEPPPVRCEWPTAGCRLCGGELGPGGRAVLACGHAFHAGAAAGCRGICGWARTVRERAVPRSACACCAPPPDVPRVVPVCPVCCSKKVEVLYPEPVIELMVPTAKVPPI